MVVKRFKRAIRLLKKVIWKTLNYVWLQLKKVPAFMWIIVLAMASAQSLFWIGLLQNDSLIWSIPNCENWHDWLWVPQLGLTYYVCLILFMNLQILGFCILAAVIVWLTAEHLQAWLKN